MNIAQQGAYHRLLCYAWTDRDCGVPDDAALLQKITGWDEEKFGLFDPVLACFPPHPSAPGKRANPRLMEECAKTRQIQQVRRRAAQTKWDKQKAVKNEKIQKRHAAKPNGKTAFPNDWKPTSEELEPWRKFGIDPHIEFASFRDHARSIDRRLSDWRAGFRNWCRKAIRINERKTI